ncbi:MAG: hypothetical protein JWP12_3319 [Bacteroidetes bacterium]|nr:hypothetical protein [Bacteroidota bacterium]
MTTKLNSIFIGYMGLGGSEMLIILFLVLIIAVVPLILFLVTLQNTFRLISMENRRMPGEQVWLTLIPVFGMIWQFIIVNRIADSLKYEFMKRNIRSDEDRPGVMIGITYCILNCCSIIPAIGLFTGIAGLVCWIIYWSKINGYKLQLQYNQQAYSHQEIN